MSETSNSIRILVVDDERCLRILLSRFAEKLGAEVMAFEEGGAAIQHIRETGQVFDVALLDLTVPAGMGGQESIAPLQELLPQLRAVAMSGYANSQVMARCTDYGFVTALHKPFTINEFFDTVKGVMTEPPPEK